MIPRYSVLSRNSIAFKRSPLIIPDLVSLSTNREIVLKILAHNNLIGRIIGKSGNTIKRIMQDTETKITVSSINDINSFNLERIITVKGQIDNMSRAENQISSKLRQSYENDLQAMAPQSIMFPGLHPMAMMSTAGSGMGFPNRTNAASAGVYPGPNYPVYQPPAGVPPGANDAQETTYLYIPNNAVGAIIGTKGSHIRNIIRFSGASVKIAPLEADKPVEQQPERKVTIVGSPEAQWKAQYLIFEKMREEGFASGTDDVRLTVEILVASSQVSVVSVVMAEIVIVLRWGTIIFNKLLISLALKVGRIIGKGGQNVRELQRVTGSIIKLPEHGTALPVEEETTVHIIGPFFSVQVSHITHFILPPVSYANQILVFSFIQHSLHNVASEPWCSQQIRHQLRRKAAKNQKIHRQAAAASRSRKQLPNKLCKTHQQIKTKSFVKS